MLAGNTDANFRTTRGKEARDTRVRLRKYKYLKWDISRVVMIPPRDSYIITGDQYGGEGQILDSA